MTASVSNSDAYVAGFYDARDGNPFSPRNGSRKSYLNGFKDGKADREEMRALTARVAAFKVNVRSE